MKKPFVIGVARDVSLISYCHPDLIITINRASLAEAIPIIAINDFFSGQFLPLMDTDLMALFCSKKIKEAKIPEFVLIKKDEIQREVFKQILEMAGRRPVVINPYYKAFSHGFQEKGFLVIGPSDKNVLSLDKKIVTHQLAKKNNLFVAKGFVKKDLAQVKKDFSKIKKQFGSFFLAAYDTPFYPTNRHIKSFKDLKGLSKNSPLLLTRWLNKTASPNSQVLIGKRQILFLGLTDQIIKEEIKYFGNLFPSGLSLKQQKEIERLTLILAKAMQKMGYRGLAGFDWFVDDGGQILFSEINPRKNRSSAILIAAYDTFKNKDAQTIFEMEIAASNEKRFFPVKINLPKNLFWAMERYKVFEPMVITRQLSSDFIEADSFLDKNKNSFSIFNPFPKGMIVGPACPDIARIFSIGSSPEKVLSNLEKAKQKIKNSLQIKTPIK